MSTLLAQKNLCVAREWEREMERERESATFIVCKALFIILRAFHSVFFCPSLHYPAAPLCYHSVGIPLAPSSSTSLYAALGWREHL